MWKKRKPPGFFPEVKRKKGNVIENLIDICCSADVGIHRWSPSSWIFQNGLNWTQFPRILQSSHLGTEKQCWAAIGQGDTLRPNDQNSSSPFYSLSSPTWAALSPLALLLDLSWAQQLLRAVSFGSRRPTELFCSAVMPGPTSAYAQLAPAAVTQTMPANYRSYRNTMWVSTALGLQSSPAWLTSSRNRQNHFLQKHG